MFEAKLHLLTSPKSVVRELASSMLFCIFIQHAGYVSFYYNSKLSCVWNARFGF